MSRSLSSVVDNFSPDLKAVIRMATPVRGGESETLRRLGERAFESLVAVFTPLALAFAIRVLSRAGRPSADAPDLVNRALFNLWRCGFCEGQYHVSRVTVAVYFRAILRNEIRSFLRRPRPPGPPGDILNNVGGGDPLPGIIEREEVWSVIGLLPPLDREMLSYLIDGFSSDEIAAATTRSIEQVYRLTFRARERFRKEWQQRERRQHDTDWLEALMAWDEGESVVCQLPPDEGQLLLLLHSGYSVEDISTLIQLPKEETHRRIRAAKVLFSELWQTRPGRGASQ